MIGIMNERIYVLMYISYHHMEFFVPHPLHDIDNDSYWTDELSSQCCMTNDYAIKQIGYYSVNTPYNSSFKMMVVTYEEAEVLSVMNI